MGILGPALLFLLALGAPIGIALIATTVGFILYDPLLSESAIFRSFFSFLNKYTLMAIPFFIYAGFLMERTGLIKKLFRFADALIGWVPGGFAYATILAAVMFGAISGSSTAMAAAMGVVAFPEMIRSRRSALYFFTLHWPVPSRSPFSKRRPKLIDNAPRLAPSSTPPGSVGTYSPGMPRAPVGLTTSMIWFRTILGDSSCSPAADPREAAS